MAPGQSVMTQNSKFGELREILMDLYTVAMYETNHVLNMRSANRKEAKDGVSSANPNLSNHGKAVLMKHALQSIENEMLSPMRWNEFWGESGELNFLFSESEETIARSNVGKVVRHLHQMLNTSAKGAQPRGEEAVRILSFFMGSLKNPTLVNPPSLDEMLSWTVLTPHYGEDVLYALNRKEVARHLGLEGSNPDEISDLMTPNEDGVTVMAWLRSNYSLDWDNLMERLEPELKKANINPKSVREADFDEGGPLASSRNQLLQWASSVSYTHLRAHET